MVKHHFLIFSFPAQGHINPALQLAKRLIGIGVQVTFVLNTFTRRRMNKIPSLEGLTLAEFSDGYDNGCKTEDKERFFSEFKRRSSETLAELIIASANKGQPVTCLVYSLCVPWAAEVAHEHHLQPTLLWIQPATVFDVYYYYFYGYGDIIRSTITEDTSCSIELPKLPLRFTSRDFPSFFNPTNPKNFRFLSLFQKHLEILTKEANPKVLVNTFDALEPNAISTIGEVNLVGIGPLIPSDNSSTVNLFKPSDHKYIEWLNTKPESSVVYISFGSLSTLSKRQMEEMERGLLESGRPFLWVIRAPQKGEDAVEEEDYYKMMSSKDLNGNMVVSWCAQVEVLSHPSVGCFVTHCGWNSTTESLVSGTPMVLFPQWSEQGTNAMLVAELWKTGVRVTMSNDDGLVDGDDIKNCLETVMGGGERGEEIRRNAKTWRGLAMEALHEDGSSDKNLKAFVDELAPVSNV